MGRPLDRRCNRTIRAVASPRSFQGEGAAGLPQLKVALDDGLKETIHLLQAHIGHLTTGARGSAHCFTLAPGACPMVETACKLAARRSRKAGVGIGAYPASEIN